MFYAFRVNLIYTFVLNNWRMSRHITCSYASFFILRGQQLASAASSADSSQSPTAASRLPPATATAAPPPPATAPKTVRRRVQIRTRRPKRAGLLPRRWKRRSQCGRGSGDWPLWPELCGRSSRRRRSRHGERGGRSFWKRGRVLPIQGTGRIQRPRSDRRKGGREEECHRGDYCDDEQDEDGGQRQEGRPPSPQGRAAGRGRVSGGGWRRRCRLWGRRSWRSIQTLRSQVGEIALI